MADPVAEFPGRARVQEDLADDVLKFIELEAEMSALAEKYGGSLANVGTADGPRNLKAAAQLRKIGIDMRISPKTKGTDAWVGETRCELKSGLVHVGKKGELVGGGAMFHRREDETMKDTLQHDFYVFSFMVTERGEEPVEIWHAPVGSVFHAIVAEWAELHPFAPGSDPKKKFSRKDVMAGSRLVWKRSL